MRLLITRPEAEAARTAEALRARGHQVVLAPLLRIETMAADLSGPWTAVVLTSANAARALASHPERERLVGLPVVAVGDRSAAAAREAGFTDVSSARGVLADLVHLVAERFRGDRGAFLYAAGEDRSGDLAIDLAEHGLAVRTIVTYRAVATHHLPPDIRRTLEAREVDGALHYSARSVSTLLTLAEAAGVLNAVLNLEHYCLSAVSAAPLRERGAGRVAVAASPREAALVDLVGFA
jgi:uroporphyrinogen-III synthase